MPGGDSASPSNNPNQLTQAAASLAAWINRVAARRPGAWAIGVVLLAMMVSFASKVPPYWESADKGSVTFSAFGATPHGRAINWWLDHPFAEVPVGDFITPEMCRDPLLAGVASHLDKLTFRATLPLLNRIFHGGYWTLVGASHAAVLVTFGLLYGLGRRVTRDAAAGTFLALAYAASGGAALGFADMSFGDAVAIALLLGGIAARPRWLATLLVLLAAFTDERAVFAAPLVALFRSWLAQTVDRQSEKVPRRTLLPVLYALGLYAAIRLTLASQLGIETGTTMVGRSEIVLYHLFVSFPGRVFEVFEFLWFFPALFLLTGVVSPGRSRWMAACLLATLATAAAPGLLVWDASRSVLYLLPGVAAAALFVPVSLERRRELLLAAALASLVWIEFYGSIFRRLIL